MLFKFFLRFARFINNLTEKIFVNAHAHNKVPLRNCRDGRLIALCSLFSKLTARFKLSPLLIFLHLVFHMH